jgi:hypothetical protein
MLYELRVYRCMPGRLPDLNKRFETITLKLWEKHGIRPVGFWTTLVGESNQELHYLLEWKDMAERERVFGGFMADPDWQKARAETEKNGQLVANIANTFLAPTAYSKMK